MKAFQEGEYRPSSNFKKEEQYIVKHTDSPCNCFKDYLNHKRLDIIVLLASPASIPGLVSHYKHWKFDLKFCIFSSEWIEFTSKLKQIVLSRALKSVYKVDSEDGVTDNSTPQYVEMSNKSGKKI